MTSANVTFTDGEMDDIDSAMLIPDVNARHDRLYVVIKGIVAGRRAGIEAEALLDAALDYDYSGDPVQWLTSRADDLATPRGQAAGNDADASRREYPEGVTPDAVDHAVSAVFAEFPGDTWRQRSLREVVGVVACSLRLRTGKLHL